MKLTRIMKYIQFKPDAMASVEDIEASSWLYPQVTLNGETGQETICQLTDEQFDPLSEEMVANATPQSVCRRQRRLLRRIVIKGSKGASRRTCAQRLRLGRRLLKNFAVENRRRDVGSGDAISLASPSIPLPYCMHPFSTWGSRPQTPGTCAAKIHISFKMFS